MQETWFQSLGQEDPLEKGMETHSSILDWRIPGTEGPGRLELMGSQRVRHDWVTKTFTFWVSYNLVGLMDANPAGFQNFVFGELFSDPQVLKVWMPDDAGCKPLPSQGKSSEYEFSPNCGSLHLLGFMARLCLSLSYPFSFARYVGISQLVSTTTPSARKLFCM